jgi:hypothetical protein
MSPIPGKPVGNMEQSLCTEHKLTVLRLARNLGSSIPTFPFRIFRAQNIAVFFSYLRFRQRSWP